MYTMAREFKEFSQGHIFEKYMGIFFQLMSST